MKFKTIILSMNSDVVIFTLGSHGEERIESNHTIDSGHGDAQSGRYQALHIFREIAHKMLGLMKYVYEFARAVPMTGTDFIHFG